MFIKKSLVIAGVLCLSLGTLSSVSAAEKSTSNESNIVLQASDINFYRTLSDNAQKEKEVGLIEHKEAIALVEKNMLKNDVKIETDFDNLNYQQYVLSLGTAFDEFSPEEMKNIISFVKFMDLYENYDKNEKLREYKDLLKQKKQLSNEDLIILDELMPIPYDSGTKGNSESTLNLANQIEPSFEFSVATVFANGYDNIAARDYAYDWWNGRNPTYSTYYAEKNGCDVTQSSCWTKWNDCTNFVSQALYEGGMVFKFGATYTSDQSWHFGPLVPSYTWGGANNFYKHWKVRAGVASSVSDLQTGDAVNADFNLDGDIDHTAIITKNTGNFNNNKYLTQHTSDKKETTTLADWYGASYNVYGYEIDKATNY